MRFRSLTTTFIVVVGAAFFVVAAAFTWVVLRQAAESREHHRLSDVLRGTMELNQALRADLDEQTSLVYRYLDGRDPRLVEEYEALHIAVGRRQVEYLKMEIGDQERLHVARIRDLQQELARRGSMAMGASRADDTDRAMRHLAQMGQVQSQVNSVFEQLSALQVAQLDGALSRADEAVRFTYVALMGIVAVLGALLATVAALLRGRVQRPLAALLEAARRIRQGDLTARAPHEGRDEVGRVAVEFNFMARSLEDSYASLEQKVDERTAEVRALQEQMVETERMSAMGQLVSGVAHELNNPLTTILGFAELERDERRETEPERPPDSVATAWSALDEIIHQAERCRRIVADLLQFARQRETAFANIDLNAIVERTMRLREYEAETKGIRLLRDYDDASPVVYADPYKMEQVTLILVNNAIDAIQETGQSGVVTVTTRHGGERASLEVEDTGGGLREPQRVFEPFYTTKEVGKGTGLGLSVAYGIVSDHGGEIHGDNGPDGARFTIELPLAEDQSPPQETEVAEAGPAAAQDPMVGRILVVDDETALLRLQERMARGMGLEVETAESGDAAVELMGRRSFDAVVCDLRMPGQLDGKGVYAWTREHRPELADRFVFTSGDLMQLAADGALPARCLQKPFKQQEYQQVISELLRKKTT